MSRHQSKDQLGEIITFEFPAHKIISLVPSQTELLFDLGLAEQIAGRTRFCIHPAALLENIPIVGGTKEFDFHVIDRIHPDLIIGNKEENYESGIRLLKKKYAVWMSDIYTLQHAFEMVLRLGELTDKVSKASAIVNIIRTSFDSFEKIKPKKAVYLIWRKPWMAAGSNTFINDILHHIGFTNGVDRERYPTLSLDDLKLIDPQVVLLSSEPFPFKEKHIDELKLVLPKAKFLLVDGEMFSWYGSRLQFACDYFRSLPI